MAREYVKTTIVTQTRSSAVTERPRNEYFIMSLKVIRSRTDGRTDIARQHKPHRAAKI